MACWDLVNNKDIIWFGKVEGKCQVFLRHLLPVLFVNFL
jgi:hypothetical protein